MTVSIPWPTTIGQMLVWSQVVLLWTIAAYAVSADTTDQRSSRPASRMPPGLASERRTLWAAAGGAVAVGLTPGFAMTDVIARLLLASGVFALVLVLPFIRGRLAWSEARALSIAGWEVAVNAALISFVAVVIAASDMSITTPVLVVPATEGRLAAACVVAATAIFLCRGGTYVVRSILDAAGAVPRRYAGREADPRGEMTGSDAVPPDVDTSEYNRGRLIGNIERLLLAFVAVIGSYEAIGFLVAAKGLIRAREFEDRDFAEYFIIGSLASVLVAFVAGMVLRLVVPYLWRH